MKKCYHVEIPYNTREYIKRAGLFKAFLENAGIHWEPSQAGDYIHIAIIMDPDMVPAVNAALDRIVWYDAIVNV